MVISWWYSPLHMPKIMGEFHNVSRPCLSYERVRCVFTLMVTLIAEVYEVILKGTVTAGDGMRSRAMACMLLPHETLFTLWAWCLALCGGAWCVTGRVLHGCIKGTHEVARAGGVRVALGAMVFMAVVAGCSGGDARRATGEWSERMEMHSHGIRGSVGR